MRLVVRIAGHALLLLFCFTASAQQSDVSFFKLKPADFSVPADVDTTYAQSLSQILERVISRQILMAGFPLFMR
jgi:hypothetical protein